MADHPTQPCATCPYRKDAPRGHWHPSEFHDLLRAEQRPLGAVYACHGHARVASGDRGMCAGWLLDQKARGLPSLSLRMLLSRDESAVRALDAVNADGIRLYPSVLAMCRANGVLR